MSYMHCNSSIKCLVPMNTKVLGFTKGSVLLAYHNVI